MHSRQLCILKSMMIRHIMKGFHNTKFFEWSTRTLFFTFLLGFIPAKMSIRGGGTPLKESRDPTPVLHYISSMFYL